MNHKTKLPLMSELALLADKSAENATLSAFLLKALTAVMPNDEPDVIEGAKLCAQMLQSRTLELSQNLDRVCARYRSEHHGADSQDR